MDQNVFAFNSLVEGNHFDAGLIAVITAITAITVTGFAADQVDVGDMCSAICTGATASCGPFIR